MDIFHSFIHASSAVDIVNIIQVFPDLNLEPDRLFNPFFYHSRLSIGKDCTSISKFQFSTTCSRYHQSDNKSRIGEKWVLRSVSFQVEIRTDLYCWSGMQTVDNKDLNIMKWIYFDKLIGAKRLSSNIIIIIFIVF